jgi:hypothetical protein
MIEAAPAASQGRISGPSGAAAKSGLPSRILDSKIKRLKINIYRFKTPARQLNMAQFPTDTIFAGARSRNGGEAGCSTR